MTNPLDTTNATGTAATDTEPTRPSPARLDTPGEPEHPPKAGSNAAKNEERKTQPSRNRGVTDV